MCHSSGIKKIRHFSLFFTKWRRQANGKCSVCGGVADYAKMKNKKSDKMEIKKEKEEKDAS